MIVQLFDPISNKISSVIKNSLFTEFRYLVFKYLFFDPSKIHLLYQELGKENFQLTTQEKFERIFKQYLTTKNTRIFFQVNINIDSFHISKQQISERLINEFYQCNRDEIIQYCTNLYLYLYGNLKALFRAPPLYELRKELEYKEFVDNLKIKLQKYSRQIADYFSKIYDTFVYFHQFEDLIFPYVREEFLQAIKTSKINIQDIIKVDCLQDELMFKRFHLLNNSKFSRLLARNSQLQEYQQRPLGVQAFRRLQSKLKERIKLLTSHLKINYSMIKSDYDAVIKYIDNSNISAEDQIIMLKNIKYLKE